MIKRNYSIDWLMQNSSEDIMKFNGDGPIDSNETIDELAYHMSVEFGANEQDANIIVDNSIKFIDKDGNVKYDYLPEAKRAAESGPYSEQVTSIFSKIGRKINDFICGTATATERIGTSLGELTEKTDEEIEADEMSGRLYAKKRHQNVVTEQRIKNLVTVSKPRLIKYAGILILTGLLIGALRFNELEKSIDTIFSATSTILEKAIEALSVVANFSLAFVPLLIGSLLLYYSLSDHDPRDNKGLFGSLVIFSAKIGMAIDQAVSGDVTYSKIDRLCNSLNDLYYRLER